MSQDVNLTSNVEPSRREFIKGASMGSLMLMMGGVPIQAAEAPGAAAPQETHYNSEVAPMNIAVIGCGTWGKEIIQTLALLKNAPVVAICDSYKPFLNKAKNLAPNAVAVEDYKQVLEMKSVEAVIVATPTHLHKDIVIDALKAGKHVYCEAPLAHTIEDTIAIAKAARDAVKLNFQSGLQYRSEPMKYSVRTFMRNGAVGQAFLVRSQWHQKTSWRRSAPTPEREAAVNWRLDSNLSLGLAGEVGIHQIDLANWFMAKKPLAVTGFGTIANWDDGRTVPDTIQSFLQYPGKANFFYDASLANSYQGNYDIVFGNTAAIAMIQNEEGKNEAWWFKEADANLVGWEIYAKSKQFGRETGISLSADASHSVKSANAAPASAYLDSPLHYSLKAFIKNSHDIPKDVAEFLTAFPDSDVDTVREHIANAPKSAGGHAAGYIEGFEATVTAIKVNEAITTGNKVIIKPELYSLA